MKAPRSLLLLDVETTGLDPRRDELCEVGAILFSVPFRAPICQLSYLLAVLENPAASINGIEPGLTQIPLPGAQPLALLRAMASAADAFVAHHAAFDQAWIEPLLAGIARPWICTYEGIDWPDLRPNPSLSALALAHGVPVWAAHRALTDCIYLAQVLERTPDLEALLLQGLEPRVLVAADLPFQRRQEAKDAGFRWNADARRWERRLRQEQIEALPFPTTPIEP